jgi:hypothetical protein
MFHSSGAAIFQTAKSGGVVLLAGFVLMAALAGCSPPDPVEILVGEWMGDTSAIGNVTRAIQLKKDAPDAPSSTIVAGAKLMGAIGLKLSDDKTFLLVWNGKIRKGDWLYDEARKELRLTLEPEPAAANNPPQEAANAPPEADPAKATEWIGVLDLDSRDLELFMFGRETIDFMKAMESKEGKRIKGFRLRKR